MNLTCFGVEFHRVQKDELHIFGKVGAHVVFLPLQLFLKPGVRSGQLLVMGNTYEDVLETLGFLDDLVVTGPQFLAREFHEFSRDNASTRRPRLADIRGNWDGAHSSSVLSTSFCKRDLSIRERLGVFFFFPPSPPDPASPSFSASAAFASSGGFPVNRAYSLLTSFWRRSDGSHKWRIGTDNIRGGVSHPSRLDCPECCTSSRS